jgi:hypothetical protein
MSSRPLGAARNWAFWLLLAVALGLSVILAIPALRAAAFPSDAAVLVCAVIVAWFFVLGRAAGPALNWVSQYTRRRPWAGK